MSAENEAQLIQQLLAPVVMISACGLLCMAMYNRLSNIVTRLRQFHHERFGVLTQLNEGSASQQAVLRDRSEGLEAQAHQMLGRARLIRDALFGLVGCVFCMLLSSLSIGLALWVEAFESGALAFFVAGVISMLMGVCMVLAELRLSLRQVVFEHRRIETLATSITGDDKGSPRQPAEQATDGLPSGGSAS